jgi:hypothetical protein
MPTQDQEMTLAESINQFMQGMAGKVPKELMETVGGEIHKLAESGIAAKALQAGAKAPNFSLPNSQGQSVNLSD